MELTLTELLAATKGSLEMELEKTPFKGVSIDSRTLKYGEVFFAIRGDRFDGHDFVVEALQKGASGVVLERVPKAVSFELLRDKALIMVNDAKKALAGLASFWRQRHKIKVIAIGGSCGKTSTKEMVSSILSSSYNVLKTQGNLNNEIGLPMTIFGIRELHEIAVLELGVSKVGEMSRLVDMASPDVALITNIGMSHLAGFKNLNVVSQEKGELFRNLKPGGTAVVNMDDPLIREVAEGIDAERITYGIDKRADICLESYAIKDCEGIEITVSVRGRMEKTELNVLGNRNIMNALSAMATALSLNVDWQDINSGLGRFVLPEGRMQVIPLRDEIMVIDDTYNANPTSMESALKTLSQVKGNKKGIAVLGDMLDLGEESDNAHWEIGRLAAALGIDRLFYMGRYGDEVAGGALSKGMNGGRVRCLDRREEILPELIDMIKGGEWILIKGSRGMEMETIVYDLKDYFRDLKDYFNESA